MNKVDQIVELVDQFPMDSAKHLSGVSDYRIGFDKFKNKKSANKELLRLLVDAVINGDGISKCPDCDGNGAILTEYDEKALLFKHWYANCKKCKVARYLRVVKT